MSGNYKITVTASVPALNGFSFTSFDFNLILRTGSGTNTCNTLFTCSDENLAIQIITSTLVDQTYSEGSANSYEFSEFQLIESYICANSDI